MYEISKGEGKYQVLLRLWDTSNGLVGSLTGGEAPHVGGVVLAVPRPSLAGSGISCDQWLIPVPGHKDLEVAAPLAKQICSYMCVSVSLTAGIHIDRATTEDIVKIKANCLEVGREFLRLQAQKKGKV
jgi:hypothetical protein